MFLLFTNAILSVVCLITCLLFSLFLVQSRNNRLTDGMRSVADCQEILNVAKEDFLNIFKKLMDESHVEDSEKDVIPLLL